MAAKTYTGFEFEEIEGQGLLVTYWFCGKAVRAVIIERAGPDCLSTLHGLIKANGGRKVVRRRKCSTSEADASLDLASDHGDTITSR